MRCQGNKKNGYILTNLLRDINNTAIPLLWKAAIKKRISSIGFKNKRYIKWFAIKEWKEPDAVP